MIQFDCHAHVYETVTAIDGARYVPARPAPLSDWLGHLKAGGLQGGVIVQVSFLGSDNSQMCNALSHLDRRRFAGVCVVGLDVSDEQLDRLLGVGVRGVRWNLVRGAEIPDLRARTTREFLRKLRDRNMHLEIHLEGPRLAPILPALSDVGVNVVVDHFGLPSDPNPKRDPMLEAVSGMHDRAALYFKFAAHYRVKFDVLPHASELLGLLPAHHVVWGSDWPHTQHEDRAGYPDVLAFSGQLADLCDRRAVTSLYGLGQDATEDRAPEISPDAGVATVAKGGPRF